MFDILPPDRERLLIIKAYLARQRAEAETIRTYLDVQIQQVDERLNGHGGRTAPPLALPSGARPSPPVASAPSAPLEGYAIEWRRSPEGPVPERVHEASCIFAPRPGPKRARLVDAHNARELLTRGVGSCDQCHPDVALGMDM
ncbi:DUF6233 domain-containing protein [Streptomyces sp. NPDC004435]|uniref:DUF6233 domain-containing protein n=1 Tax=Streptomyces sp. NPDC004435 TaxID=3364701 RepID=UPI0036B2DC8B